MLKAARQRLKHLSYSLFRAADMAGIHILPKHYYTPVSDISWLRRHRELWIEPAALIHLGWNLDDQLSWLRYTVGDHLHEVEGLHEYDRLVAANAGPGYGPVETQVLHCFIRRHRPARVVEIGSGMSTLCMLNAARMNVAEGSAPPDITCIEPYPRAELKAVNGIRLLPQPVQSITPSVFESLQAGDLLFVDSSHAVKPGSDTLRIYLDILPNLASGVAVHIHDINLPYLYPRDTLTTYFGWMETALLLALMTDNPRLRVTACLSALHYQRTSALRQLLPDYLPQPGVAGLQGSDAYGHFPSSTYLETC